MFNTASTLDQRLTGLLFAAISLVGLFAVGSATFDDHVERQLVAQSPAAAATTLTVVAMAPTR
jgi:hypothetical protein